jgi:hypothetical protein
MVVVCYDHDGNEAWAKAGQPERAARAFEQAVLIDPGIARRPR